MRVAIAGFCARLLALAVQGASASDAPCQRLERPESAYVVCTVDLRRCEVFLARVGGDVLGSFARLRQTPNGARLAFAMNPGMYHEDRTPVGLCVENGRELKEATTASGTLRSSRACSWKATSDTHPQVLTRDPVTWRRSSRRRDRDHTA
jgi:uncharacterized protein YigE (DUF2233 family)